MSMDDLKRALDVIAQHEEDADFLGPRPETLVAKAENALGVTFPPTYRAFVLELGAGDIAGAEFYGVTTDNFKTASIPNGIWLTLRHREQYGLPKNLVLVYAVGEGTHYAIDVSKPDGPVVEWGIDSEPSDQLREVAPDFGAFLRETVERALGG